MQIVLNVNNLYEKLISTGRGKKVGGFLYCHIDLIRSILAEEVDVHETFLHFAKQGIRYNVIKIRRPAHISFLLYENFEEPFPVLSTSLVCNVERDTSKRLDYTTRKNPPILHRKELLLAVNDPRAIRGNELSIQLEELGAFTEAHRIGTRTHWENRLMQLGITIRDGSVVTT